uniref:Uncharacterized protein n=1 Tax=Romanomermis culicivorax TaxID=13658 RepID=A0A915KBA1_ROMCU
MTAHQSRKFSNKHHVSTAATRNKNTEDGAVAVFSLCDACYDKDVAKRGTATDDQLSMKEIVLLISHLLKMDETQTGDVHCMCDQCLDFPTYNDERLKHVELYKNYTGDYGYLK